MFLLAMLLLFSHQVIFKSSDPLTAARQAFLSFINSWSLLSFMSIELVMLSNYLILCCSLLLLPSVFPSIRVFSNELALLIRWPEYWSFNFSISPSDEYSGLISFRIDWFDLFSVQETPKGLLQHHNSKVSIFQHSVFFMVQFSHQYVTTRKTIALSLWTFVGKVMPLFFWLCCLRERSLAGYSPWGCRELDITEHTHMRACFVKAFLLRSKPLLILWLQSLSTVILEPKKIKSVTVSIFSPSVCHEVMGWMP